MALTTNDAIKALIDHFAEHGKGKSMDYVYGFMDALAVLRDINGPVSTDSAQAPVVSSL